MTSSSRTECSEAHPVLDVLLADFGVYRCNTKLSAETKLVRFFIPFTGFGSVKNDWILMSTAHSSLTHTHPNTHTTLTFGQRKRRAPIVVENGHPNHCKNELCQKTNKSGKRTSFGIDVAVINFRFHANLRCVKAATRSKTTTPTTAHGQSSGNRMVTSNQP